MDISVFVPGHITGFFNIENNVNPLKNGTVVESGNWLDYYETKSVANTLFSLLAKK